MRTHNIPSCYRKSEILIMPPNLPGAFITPHWLKLPLSRTNFHHPKGVSATEDRLYEVNWYTFRGRNTAILKLLTPSKTAA